MKSRVMMIAQSWMSLMILMSLSPALASAVEIHCSNRGWENFGRSKLSELTIVHETGRTPVLKTRGNIPMKGSVAIDPTSGASIYRFQGLYSAQIRCSWQCGTGRTTWDDFKDFIYSESDCRDELESLTIEYRPGNETQVARIQRKYRIRQELLLMPMPGFTAKWYDFGTTEITLEKCEVR